MREKNRELHMESDLLKAHIKDLKVNIIGFAKKVFKEQFKTFSGHGNDYFLLGPLVILGNRIGIPLPFYINFDNICLRNTDKSS
ncbi:hypothetical protein P4308_18625 [Bacillus wiedmannii]|uniref:hypothetical protein n=1 Tax=Bacillus wiedmannii TaxID=1890302 RepID=UPI002E21AA08|nr:hypothetical protein [Bacillus wiedmannii]